MKIVFTSFILPHEIDDLENTLHRLKECSLYLDPKDKVSIKVSLNLSDQLINWQDSELKQDYFKNAFESLKQLENDDLKVISLIPNIMGMMGDRMPMLLKDTDVRRILKDDTLEEHIESKKLKFDTGESIIVCEGPFKEFSGIIKEVKGDRVDVEIKIFGRNTAVSLTLDQIQKP